MAYSSRLELVVDSRSGETSLRRFRGELEGVERRGKTTASSMDLLRKSIGPLSAALGSVFTVNTLRNQIAFADELQKINIRIGASTEALSQYNYVAKLSGVQFNQLTTAWQRQTRRIAEAAEGTGAAVDALERLNLSARELRDLSPEAQFERIAGAMQGVSSASERTALAMKLWDTEGVKLVQIVNQGADAIERMKAEADSLGLTISQQTADDMASFNDEMDRLAFAARGVSQTMLAELVPSMTSGLQSVSEFIDEAGGAENVLDAIKLAAGGVATIMAGRLTASLTTAAAAKLAATQQAIAYQAALARMAGVSRTAAAATGALNGALALVGGPVGAAIVAAGAIYYFRDELGLTQQQTGLTTDELADLRAELDDMNRDDLGASLDTLNTRLEQATLLAATAREELAALRAEENRGAGVLGFGAGEVGAEVRGMQAVAKAEAKLAEIKQRRSEVQRELNERDEEGVERLEDMTVTADRAAGGMDSIATSTTAAADAASGYSDELQALRRRLQPGYADAERFARGLNTVNLALAAGKISLGEYAELVQMLQGEMQGAGDSIRDLGDTNADTAQEMSREWERFGNSVDETFKDAFKGAFDSFEDFADQLKGAFENLLAELAYAAVKNEIRIQLGMQGSGPMQGGISSLMGGQGGGFGFNGLGAVAKGADKLFGTDIYGAARNALGIGSSLGAAGTAATGYAGAGWASSVATGGYTGWAGSAAAGSAAAGGGLMSTVGAAMPWVGGAMLLDSLTGGKIIGGIAKGLFGGSWETKDGGLRLKVENGDFHGTTYDRQRKSGGWFRSSKSRERHFPMDRSAYNALSETYEAQEAALDSTLRVLGQQTSALHAFSTGITKISTKGMSSQEVEQAVQDWLHKTVNRAARSVVDPSRYAMEGEATVDTLHRLASALSSVNPMLRQLHDFAFDASLAGADAAHSLASMAGGMQNLSAMQGQYYQEYYTQAEKESRLRQQVAYEMARANLRMPDTREGFRELVEAQDLNIEAGRKAYAALMSVSGAFAQLTPEIERAYDAANNIHDKISQLTDDLDRLTGEIDGLKGDVVKAWQAFDRQAFGQQLALLELMGDGEAALALQRERELISIDPLLHETQRRIWALQDEAAVQQEAAKAATSYANAVAELAGALSGIGQWIDTQRATGQSPGNNLTASGDQFARQLALAESGDRSALQSITQYADQYLAAGRDMYASGSGFQRIESDVIAALEGLPDAMSDAEYIVEGFRDIVSLEMANEIERAILESQYTIDTLITFAADDDELPDDLRTILGEQTHRLDSTLNYLIGTNELSAEDRLLALEPTNSLISTVSWLAGNDELSDEDKKLALTPLNTLSSTLELLSGTDELSGEDRRLALEPINNLISTVNWLAGDDELSAEDRLLALEPINTYTSTIDLILGQNISGRNRKLALESGSTYKTYLDYALRDDVSENDRYLALEEGNAYQTLIKNILEADITEEDRYLALESGNDYGANIAFAVTKDISEANRKLALDGGDTFEATIDYIIGDNELDADLRTLALESGQDFQANVYAILDEDSISKDIRKLALEEQNDVSSTIYAAITNQGLSKEVRKLGIEESNNVSAIISGSITKKGLSKAVRKLGLDTANNLETTISGLLDKSITPDSDVRKLGLEKTHTLTTTVNGILAKNLPDDIERLAIKGSGDYAVTLKASLADGRLSNDERRVLDAKAGEITKTLLKGGGITLTDDERAAINAASGERKLELLADVAFNETDLGELEDISKNTKDGQKSIAEQASEQLDKLGEMILSMGQLSDMNSSMGGLGAALDGLSIKQSEANRIQRELIELQREGLRQQKQDAYYQTRAATIPLMQAAMDKSADSIAAAREKLTSNQVSFYDRFIESNAANGPTGRMDQEDWERIRANIAANDNLSHAEKQYVLHRAATLLREHRIDSWEDVIKRHEYTPDQFFASGGAFTNGIVTEPTGFNMGLMGEAGPEAIMPLHRGGDGSLGIRAELPALPPLLGQGDVVEVLQDLKRENQKLRQDLNRVLGNIEKHGAASVQVQQAGFTRQIEEQRRGNRSLDEMSSNARLEAAR